MELHQTSTKRNFVKKIQTQTRYELHSTNERFINLAVRFMKSNKNESVHCCDGSGVNVSIISPMLRGGTPSCITGNCRLLVLLSRDKPWSQQQQCFTVHDQLNNTHAVPTLLLIVLIDFATNQRRKRNHNKDISFTIKRYKVELPKERENAHQCCNLTKTRC